MLQNLMNWIFVLLKKVNIFNNMNQRNNNKHNTIIMFITERETYCNVPNIVPKEKYTSWKPLNDLTGLH